MDKFSELIKQGVAKFNYTNIAPEIPEQDPICRLYNNIWSIPSDTHMHLDEKTGNRYITGHMVGIETQWQKFLYSCSWGAVTFRNTGYWSLGDMLSKFGLTGNITVLNGDTVYEIYPIPTISDEAEYKCNCPTCCTTSESKISMPITCLTTDGNRSHIVSCYNSKNSLYQVAEALNEHSYVCGNNWTVIGENIYCPFGNKVYIL